MALASVESLVADVNTFSVILAFVILSEYDGAPSTGWPPTGYRIPWANTVLDCLQEKSMPELPGGRGNVLPASPIQGTDQSSAGVTGQSNAGPAV